MIVGCDLFDDFVFIVWVVLESLVENILDGIIVLVIWVVIVGLLGIVVYKVINMLDLMIGYCSLCYLLFGCIVVWLDDVVNILVLWLMGLLFVVVVWVVVWFG